MESLDKTEKKDSRDTEYRRRILAAARSLLEQNGIDMVNMYQIAQEAGIGQGTLYRRYSHPGEIYSDLLRTSLEQFLDELEAQQNEASSSSSALDRLYQVIIRAVHYIDDNAEMLSSIHCMYAGKKDFQLHKRPVMVRLHDLINAHLRLAVEQNETFNLDTKLTTQFLLSAFSPEQYLHHRDTLGYSKDQYLAGIHRVFIEGIRVKAD